VLAEALVEMGYCASSGGVYSVTEDTITRLVDAGGPAYDGHFWNFLLYLINPWQSLPFVLKNGKPDETSFAGLSMHDFIRGMDSPWKRRLAPEIVDICLKQCGYARSAADIGGAPGTIAREFALRGVRTIVFDLPEAIAVTRRDLSLLPGIEIQEGDATRSLPSGGYDIAFLGNICHGQSPEDNAAIIGMCHEHLNEGGIIAVFDNLRGESFRGAVLALHMLTQSPHGDIYSRAEYIGWLGSAGFNDMAVFQLSDPAWQLLIGKK